MPEKVDKSDQKQSLMEAKEQLRIKYESNIRYIEELLKEKGALRESVVERLGDIEQQMKQLEDENRQLRDRLIDLQKEMSKLAIKQEEESAQLQAVLLQDESLINVQVASMQIHSTLEFMEVVTMIGEIIINLVGSENFALCLRREGDQSLVPVHTWGSRGRQQEEIRIGEGPIGLQLQTAEPYFWRRKREGADNNPMAAIPLVITGEVIGAIILYDLLPQKEELTPTDDDLLNCLSQQAGGALLTASLYEEQGQKGLNFPSSHFH